MRTKRPRPDRWAAFLERHPRLYAAILAAARRREVRYSHAQRTYRVAL